MNQKVLKLLYVACFLIFQSAIAQTTVTGKVTDASDGTVLPGVNVIEKGTSNGVTTDINGNYSIDVSSENAVLTFSFVGYATKDIPVNGQSAINVTLEESAEGLDEVVITALGIKKSTKALGYSVTEVGGQELSTIKQPNAINALQGKIAGVNITQNATGAAGSSRVIIRGSSSLSGDNQPLYIVDGIPIGNNNNGSAGLWGGSDGGDGISSVNPDDIESVRVLKGGSATALYGSRAANGVIMITTKTGKGQKGFGVELSSSITFDNVDTSLQDFQTEYGQGRFGVAPTSVGQALEFGTSSWGARLDGSSVVQWDGTSRPYSYVGNNLDHFYRTGTTFINTIGLSSVSENSNIRFSASNIDNNDLMPNAGLNRKSFSLNAGTVLGKKITANISAKYIIENVKNRPRLSDAPGNGNFTVSNLSPNVDVRFMNPGTNDDGTERRYSDNTFSQNPYFAAFNFRNEDVKNRIIASASLRYDIYDWLYVSGRIGADHYTIKRVAVEPWGTAYKPLGGINETEFRYTQIDADVILGASHDFTDKISTELILGANSNHIKNESLNLGGSDFIVPGLEDLANTQNQNRGRAFGQRKIGSLYSSLEVSYDNFAYLTFTGRNDWLSTLSFPGKTSPNNDFYTSISGSLIMSEILELPKEINFFKIRGGYSEVAGGAQDPYQLALTYRIFGQGHQGQPLGGITNNSVPNANLIPFEKSEFEIGTDLRLFNNKLSLDFAYYRNETTKDIVPVSASIFSGFGSAIANIGTVENKGVEFLISGTPIKNENFKWNISFNGTSNKGKVISTNESNGAISLGAPRTRNIDVRQIVGQAYGTLFGVSYERDQNGNIIYDINSDGVPLARRGARKILGSGIPSFIFGISNTISYKDFTLNFLIDGKSGGQIFSGTNAVTYGNGLHKNTLNGRESGLSVSGIDGATNQPFTTTVAPKDLQTYYGRISSIAEEFVYDSDFIKLRQLSIGYNIPSKILEKTFLQSANITFIASNLFYLKRTVDNIDPESAYNVSNAQGLEYFGLPSARSYGFSLNVKF